MILSSAESTVRQRNCRNGKPPRFWRSSCCIMLSVMARVVRSDSKGLIHLGNLGTFPKKLLRYLGNHAKSTMNSLDIPVESMCSSWIFFRLHNESSNGFLWLSCNVPSSEIWRILSSVRLPNSFVKFAQLLTPTDDSNCRDSMLPIPGGSTTDGSIYRCISRLSRTTVEGHDNLLSPILAKLGSLKEETSG